MQARHALNKYEVVFEHCWALTLLQPLIIFLTAQHVVPDVLIVYSEDGFCRISLEFGDPALA
jgi:hypothetical protein